MTATAASNRPDRVVSGIVLILMSTVLVALQEATFKFASSDMTLWQLFVMRSFFLIPVLLAIAAFWGMGPGTWREAFKPWPLARSVLFVLMYLATYSVLPYLHLSTVAAAIYTAPLFVAALSPVLLGEPVRWTGRLAILLGFCGVLVMLRPGTQDFTWIALVPVLGGFFYALAAIVTRAKCREVTPPAMAVSLAVATLVAGLTASLLIILFQPTASSMATSPFLLGSWVTFGGPEWVVIGLLTVLMIANGMALPAAYQRAPTVIIATFDYCYLIFATLFGFLIFSEVPDLQAIIGMVMIVLAGLIVARG